ncbi:MAG: BsaWI family type II restriction enzyme [Pseudomonas sp.]|uniref:BsaWI family type II restriction enzyme n=1 Tax=Pseudomonas sp. TaxID=306 RepID=UPI002734C8FF|nr:BsaWI family type II restriction enzyme [Pseudomonas sp.]MDP3846875.1 BsaWI family type II restriction enzyme [Pseudomonas sp.]
MKITYTEKYNRLLDLLVKQRKNANINQQFLANLFDVNQSIISRYESCELRLDIELLARWCEAIDITLESALLLSGYIQQETSNFEESKQNVSTNSDVAYPIGANKTESGFNLILQWQEKNFEIKFPGSEIKKYKEIEKTITNLFSELNLTGQKKKNRDAIAEALHLAISLMPEANPSDIYHHIVYRLYLREYKRSNSSQSWARAGGEALELFFKWHYAPLLAPHGISIQLGFESGKKNKFMTEMGLADEVAGSSKLDICLYGMGKNGLIPFGGVHAKASLAERVSDDKPCSERMMMAGYKSYLFTLDAKSFPPPTGNLINLGELGTIQQPSDKRDYIEKHGSFDACFSYNTRTIPSDKKTASGKHIYVSYFDNNDTLITLITDDWKKWKAKNKQ